MTSPLYSPADLKALREWSGQGLDACRRAFEMALDPDLGLSDRLQGDVVWAICTVEAGSLAVNVKGGASARTEWNLTHGARRAEHLRSLDPSLNERYPVRNTRPSADTPALSSP